MSSARPRAVPWQSLVRFHREVSRRAEQALFALPVTVAATERWGSLAGFEPAQLGGPWDTDAGALESDPLRASAETGLDEAYLGGPCWFRWKSAGDQGRRLEWIPLVYRRVDVDARDGRLHIAPAGGGWELCPLVQQYLQLNDIQTTAPLDETLPELLSTAESEAAGGDRGLTDALVDAFRSVAPQLGELLDQARDNLPADNLELVPSPWVIFTPPPGAAAVSGDTRRDYDRLVQHLAGAPQSVGGIELLENTSGPPAQSAHRVAPVIPLDDIQHAAVETVLAGRPVTVVGGPPGSGKRRVALSILLNAWSGSTSVLYASSDGRTVDAVHKRLDSLSDDCAIAVDTAGELADDVDRAIGRTLELVRSRQGEMHFGGSPTARKQGQLLKMKQLLREMIANEVPQRVNRSLRAALDAYSVEHEAASTLESQRADLTSGLRSLGVEVEPGSFDEQVVAPLRKWRDEIEPTRRLIEEDVQRDKALRNELGAHRADRDAALKDYQIETGSDGEPKWLLAEPGFKSFEEAMTALSEKLRDPIVDDGDEPDWDSAYDAWSSSEEASKFERKVREMAALARPAGIALKEKAEEIRAASEALDAAKRSVQEATKSASLDVRGSDLDEWAECYAELCALPRSKLAFRNRSRSAELLQRLEKLEGRFRISFPPHVWSGIGTLDERGRERLSAIVERGREWIHARDDWDRLIPVREEIDAEIEALRARLQVLGMSSLAKKVTPTTCAAIASELNAKASAAAAAAAAWAKRETKERLPGELMELGARIRAAGAGTPIKERWMTGAGAPLMAAIDALSSRTGVEAMNAVRDKLVGSAEVEQVVRTWRRAYEAQSEIAAVEEELERIPSRTARLARWKSRRPESLPAELDTENAFDNDDADPVWAFLAACEDWSRKWSDFREQEAAARERTDEPSGDAAIRHMREAAQALPPGKERSWIEGVLDDSKQDEPWPVKEIAERAALWRPDRLEAEIARIDGKLERIAFETAREQWLERVAVDAESLRALEALRDHYAQHDQCIDEDAFPSFQRSLKLQPVWLATPGSTRSIPLLPGLFDLLVIDDAKRCTLTDMLPLIFRAKRLVVIGDPGETPAPDSLGMDAQRTIAARCGVEGWAGLFGHVGNDVYKAAIGNLPGRKVEVVSLGDAE